MLPERSGFEEQFVRRIESTHSGLSVFLQESGPPFSLYTRYERNEPYAWYSIDHVELEWENGHRKTLATPADGYRVDAIRATGYQGKIVYRAELELPTTFDDLPDEGTEVTLKLRVTVTDGKGKRVHQVEEKYRLEHEEGCGFIMVEALEGA